MSKKMIHFLKTVFAITLLILFLSAEFAAGYTDQDVKLFNAAQKGNLEEIGDLLDRGANINIRLGVDRWTPLMTASRQGHLVRQAKGKSLTSYHVIKYLYYSIYAVMIFFIITVFKTCQVDQEKSQYEIS